MTLLRSIAAGALTVSLIGCGSNASDPASGGSTPSAAAAPAPRTGGGAVPPTLRSTIASTLKIDESKVTPSATFATDLGCDELDMVELVMAYERVFKVDIPRPDADRLKNVQDVMSYLQKHGALR